MATPVFILGKHRSGTTWLANQLCQHSRIVGVQHASHEGIHESVFFSHVEGRYGDLANRSNYVEFAEAMAASDYFRLAAADRGFLYTLFPSSYGGVFRAVMDRYAATSAADFWVEKSPSHTPLVDHIANLYPDAKFVGVHRDVVDVVASSLKRWEDVVGRRKGLRWRFIVGRVAAWMLYGRALERYARRSTRLLLLRYEELTDDLEGGLRRVCEFLDIDFEPEMCEQAFPSNTRFRNARERARMLSSAEEWAVRKVARTQRLVPGSLARLNRNRNSYAEPLPSWFFRLLWEESTTPQSEVAPEESGSPAVR